MTVGIDLLGKSDDAETAVDIFRATKSARVNVMSSIYLLRNKQTARQFVVLSLVGLCVWYG